MSVVALNSAYECSAKEGESAPDPFVGGEPSDDFVLCRDENGKPTAVYGEDIWDFNPYRLSAKTLRLFSFCKIAADDNDSNSMLVKEMKWLMFCFIYYADSGRAGRLSASTLTSYYQVLAQAGRFCIEMRGSALVGQISFKELLSNSAYLSAFVMRHSGSTSFNKRFPAMLMHLKAIGEDVVGYSVIGRENLAFGGADSEQYPIIPTRLYLKLIDHFAGVLGRLEDGKDWMSDFLAEFKDPLYGVAHQNQRAAGLSVRGGDKYRPTLQEALAYYDEEGVFSGFFSVQHKGHLPAAITKMQYVVKQVIHLYTGMRDQEVMRLGYDCLVEEEAAPATLDDEGVERDPARMVSVLSTTTKFEGYKKEASWLGTEEVVKAIQVAKAICRGLAAIIDLPVDSAPLFVNPNVITRKRKSGLINTFGKVPVIKRVLPDMQIESHDLEELEASDSGRAWGDDNRFFVGAQWPLSSHQYRRSLAFYAINAGFVSLPSLSSQYKHMTQMMTRYYSRGSDRFKSIFGYYDEEKDDFVIPQGHISFELQSGVPQAVANQVLIDLFSGEQPLFGAAGSFMESQKNIVGTDEVRILEFRKETEKRVAKGDMAYRKTLLGGCMKVGKCDDFMLGNVTACLSCPSSVIKADMLGGVIAATESELKEYEVGTGEYEVASHELSLLQSYKQSKVVKGGR